MSQLKSGTCSEPGYWRQASIHLEVNAFVIVRAYTLEPKPHGYPEETRLLAIRIYVEGSSYGSIARVLKINPQSVANWVSQYTAKLPRAPMPLKVRKAELDELYTFEGKKKTKSTF